MKKWIVLPALVAVLFRPDADSAAQTLQPGFQDSVALSGLVAPTAVRFSPDGRVFVAEQSGLIKVFDSLSDPTPTTFADLRVQVNNFWDRGLLGLALDPGFPQVPYVYVLYTHDAAIGGTAPRWGTVGVTNDTCPDPPGNGGCVVSGRLSRLEAAGNVMTGSEVVLIEDWPQQFQSHSIGSLVFGPDGALYVSAGEGASAGFVDYGQRGNMFGDPPVPVGGTQTSPTAEGGALRSQDLRTTGDPVGLSGTLLRVDPRTGAALPDNPLFLHADPNARRIVAYGLRNPYRVTIRPGTSEVWVGDAGWTAWEEVNRIASPTAAVLNFGWPCYEGAARQAGYDAANLNICENLYAQVGAVTSPYYRYAPGVQLVPGEACEFQSQVISGLAFYEGGSYPAEYDGALFFGDMARGCIWVMFKGAGGLPDPSQLATFVAGGVTPVDLRIGPEGDLFYVDYFSGSIRRISYANGTPTAVATATPRHGAVPLVVNFDGSASSDPENEPLTYDWDLDGDGVFGDSASANVVHTYHTAGTVTATLKVTDPGGRSATMPIVLTPGNTAPTPTIDTPTTALNWQVGQTIAFAGHATDTEDGEMPSSALTWSWVMHHCSTPTTCHEHNIQAIAGVSSGSFTAPDHEYPSYLELRLIATDSRALTQTTSLRLDPQTVALTFNTTPPGLQVAVGSQSFTTPVSRTVIVGSSNSISAPGPQLLGGTTYTFSSWSDGGGQTHLVAAGASPTTYTAAYAAAVTPASLTNGSFESGMAGWTATGNLAVVTAGPSYAASHDTKAVAFNGGQSTPNGVISQTFATVIGQRYALDFDAGAVSFVNTKQQRLEVTLQGNSPLASGTVAVSAPGNGSRYVAQRVLFVADSSMTTVSFRDVSLDGKSVDLLLDNARVSETAPAGGLLNGSFESDFASWTATGNQLIATNDPSHPASQGLKVVVLNPNTTNATAVLSQTFATTAGQRYGLAFDVGRMGGVIDGRLRVTVQGASVIFDQILEFAGLDASPFYIPQRFSFVANSTSTTLTFADLSISPLLVDSLLDNVRVTAEDAQLPLVTSQPQRAAVMQGRDATFSVTASGTGLTYQWQFAGSNIPGATGSSYTVTGATAGSAGNYTVVVTNGTGSVTSSGATLTVLPPAILLNGSFEYGSAAWTYNDITRVYNTLNPGYAYTDGVQLVHFGYGQRPAGGTLTQSFPTVSGQEYVLAFDAGAFSLVNQNQQRLQVTVLGQGNGPLLSQVVSVFAPGNGTSYVPQTFTFVANSSTSTLIFEDISATTTNVDPVVDNVRVTIQGARDFDGDGKSDMAVYRPSDGSWYVLKSTTNYTAWMIQQWGLSGDVPMPGDYDGDGRTDPAVYRPSNGSWYLLKSSTNFASWTIIQWGLTGDVPMPGDYDGDGRTDPAVYRPSNGSWYLLPSSTNFASWTIVQWGLTGDVPMPGDYDGDGRTDPAVYRPSNGSWYLLPSSTNYTSWIIHQWGLIGDVPMPGDYDGDGKTDMAVYRPSDGSWYVLKSTTNSTAWMIQQWGLSGDEPTPGDYDGDGKTDFAVYRPSNGSWYVLKSTTNSTAWMIQQWGIPGDIPLFRGW